MLIRFDPQREFLLLQEAQQNLLAFQELYRAYYPKVFAYTSYRVGSARDTEDLVAYIFLKVLEKLKEFEWRGEGSFAAWLFRIAHDTIIDYFRSNQGKPTIQSLDDLPDLSANDLLPDAVALQKEKFLLLRGLIAALPPRRQEIITLKFFGGLRNNEIAKVLSLDERTIASHLCRGLEDLHQRYVNSYGLVTGENSDEQTR